MKHSYKKFKEIYSVSDWEVETPDGWVNINNLGKTIEYCVWVLKTIKGKILRAANNHIIIKLTNNGYKEEYLKNLKKNDIIIVKDGIDIIESIEKTNSKEEMFDLEISSEDKTFYTNDILSHNSMWMCNLAAHSVYNGFNTAYVTLELQEEIVNMRIGSNMLNVPMDDYEDLTKDQDKLKKKLGDLKQSSLKQLGKLHVKEFPSSTMSTNDLRSYLVKTQEILGYKFDNIFVDYINIMKNWRNPNTENLYMKIKQISEDLRAIAQEEQWAIITPTQTNRSGWDSTDLQISNVSESAALLHTVDGLFGIVADPEMKSKGEYYLKYLADRVSGLENTRKKFIFQRKYARIEEDINAQIEDMDFIAASIGGFRNNTSQSTIAAHISKDPSIEIPIKGNELFTVGKK